MNIPIYNLYMMLLYVWEHASSEQLDLIDASSINSPEDLLVSILNTGTDKLLTQGMDRGYVSTSQEMPGLRGKLDFAASLRELTFEQGRSICTVDELTPNILHNQILRSTYDLLINLRSVNPTIASNARRIRSKLMHVTPIALHANCFGRVRIHKNNRVYRLLIHVCELLFHSLRPVSSLGRYRFIDYTTDMKRWEVLYEKFLNQFYERHCDWDITRPRIRWQESVQIHQSEANFLPQMKTDLVMRKDNRTLIVDAKFYSKTLSTYYEQERVRTTHLYQMYAYIQNFKRHPIYENSEVEGLLLYPQVQREIKFDWNMHGDRIRFYTVNLNQSWHAVHQELLDLI